MEIGQGREDGEDGGEDGVQLEVLKIKEKDRV